MSQKKCIKTRWVFCFLFLLCYLYSSAQNAVDHTSLKQIPLEVKFQIGTLFMNSVLGLIFLMLFLFYPRQRLNLFFSLFNISLVLLALNRQIFQEGEYSITATTADLISRLVGVNILLFMLHALKRMKPFFWWFIAFILLIDFPLGLIFKDKYQPVNQIVHSLFTVICVWLLIVAFKTKKSEDWLIGFIALGVVPINVNGMLIFFAGIDLTRSIVIQTMPFIISIAAVIYLAVRYAGTNISLEQQLTQVKILSEENLRSQQEKQEILSSQKETLEKQVTERTTELKQSLEDLKSIQTQLIQQEKMASLGELTAGIAHEIQNPLNFVNNFSEVNIELIDELDDEAQKGNLDEVKSIAKDIKENSEKINHHGKRADAIVKGMLQHSQTSTGKKELTNINALCDEYLRLAYHGFRAKEKDFNATMKTGFDESIGNINIIPQDVGRVLLNLYNNAFYAISEKKKKQPENYEPTVSIKTKKLDGKIEISVKDNGNGIPEKVVAKIFQPFFTTKPTGQGTGLGLSLSYDIIKAHGGEIKVESKEGEGSEFIIQLSTN